MGIIGRMLDGGLAVIVCGRRGQKRRSQKNGRRKRNQDEETGGIFGRPAKHLTAAQPNLRS